MLDTLRLGNLTIPLDGFGVPEAVALDGAGRRLALPASSLRWSLEDTSIAVIDPGSGRITPLRQGTSRMTVTAGGWRSATGALTVTPPKTRTVLADSTWDDLDPSPTAAGRWRLYGDPSPRRVDSTGGPALSNNGDGVYASGLYSRELFPVRDGLGIEALVSVPLSRLTWQTQSVQLVSERLIMVLGVRLADLSASLAAEARGGEKTPVSLWDLAQSKQTVHRFSTLFTA